jgi:methyl-accepting chemotaxis protein
MKKALLSQSFFVRLVLLLGIVMVAATGAKLAFIHRICHNQQINSPIFALLASGILIIDMLVYAGMYLGVYRLYTTSLRKPLTRLAAIIQGVQTSQINLLSHLSDLHCREVSLLANAAIGMLKQVKTLLAQLHEASHKMLSTSQTIFTASQQQADLLTSQADPASEMDATMHDMILTAQHISEDVQTVDEETAKTLELTQHGQHSLMTVVQSMEAIRRSAQSSSDSIIALGKKSAHINDVVKTIDRIIEDTKLIAFNATIEAARAKEEGKGFGVVALEVKRLAEEVFESTEDIKELIQDIQTESHALVLSTEAEMKTVRQGTRVAQEAGAALERIIAMLQATTESARRITSTTHQQQAAGQKVLQLVEGANNTTHQSSDAAKQLVLQAAELNILADGLRQIISRFVGGPDNGRGESHS